MANIERITKLQEAIAGSKKLWMPRWQNPSIGEGGEARNAENLQEFHECGNEACIAGHMSLMLEFRAAGGRVDLENGCPYLLVDGHVLRGEFALSAFLGIPPPHAELLTTGDCEEYEVKKWGRWNWKHAIVALEITKNCDNLTIDEYCNQLDGVYDA